MPSNQIPFRIAGTGNGDGGRNENFNGLLRQYIAKKRRMETVTDEELTMIENRLNHRPEFVFC
jgi:IS30 family transposase